MSDDKLERDCAPSQWQIIANFCLESLPLRVVKFGSVGFRCEPGVVVKSPGRLKLGQNVVIQRGSLLHCGGRIWSNYQGGIELENNVVIGPGCILYGAGTIRVGKYTHFGPRSMIMTQAGDVRSGTRLSPTPGHVNEPVVIGDGVWVGAGAVILGGSTLGNNCIVGPNSVVSGVYAAGTTLIGNPARVVRRRDEDAQ